MKKNLRVVATTLSLDEPRGSEVKLRGATRVLDEAASSRCHFVVFPAALFPVLEADEVAAKARPLIRAARKRGVGVAFGISSPKACWLIGWAPGMQSAAITSEYGAEPPVIRFPGFTVCVLSDSQLQQATSRKAATASQPDLVAVCSSSLSTMTRRGLTWCRRLGVPVAPACYSLKVVETPPLVSPRGDRHADICQLVDGFTFAMFDLDERDGALDAA